MDVQELEKLKRLRDVAHSKFKRKAKCLQEQIDRQSPTETLRRCFDEMNKTYEKLEETHESYLENICLSNNSDTELEDEESFMYNVDSSKMDVSSAYDKAIAKSFDNKETVAGNPKTEVKPNVPPKYEGDIKDCNTLKSDKEPIMTETYGDSTSVPKQCSSGESRNTNEGNEGQTTQQDCHQAIEVFKIMFPDVNVDVIEAVLRVNQGDFQRTIERLSNETQKNTDSTSQEILHKFILNMDQVSECCVCREVYNEDNHRPLNLPCGYTICKGCVNSISSKPHSTECVTVVQCPICRIEHTVNTNQLPTNFVLLNLLQFLLSSVGFTSAGIAAGSWAASMMVASAAANGGAVAAGSMVALLQSAGVAAGAAADAAAKAAAGATSGESADEKSDKKE